MPRISFPKPINADKFPKCDNPKALSALELYLIAALLYYQEEKQPINLDNIEGIFHMQYDTFQALSHLVSLGLVERYVNGREDGYYRLTQEGKEYIKAIENSISNKKKLLWNLFTTSAVGIATAIITAVMLHFLGLE